jgi:hypothetical protein
VFGDWLLQQGHPCGDLIVAALANREADTDAAEKYLGAVLGRDLSTYYRWQRGVLDAITFNHHGGEEELDKIIERLATDPAARLVRRIQIDAVQFDGEGDLEPTIAMLAELAPRFPRLSEIALREGMNLGNPWIDGPIRIGDLTPLYAAYPRLTVFELGGKDYELGEIGFYHLQKLVLDEMRPTDVTAIARANLPHLTELELFFGRWRVDGIDAVFRPLLDRAITTLATLSIASEVPQVMQYFVRAVPASILARHTRVLGFRRGVLDADCVNQLVVWAPRLRALDRLEVEGRGLTTEHRRSLERTFGRLLAIR